MIYYDSECKRPVVHGKERESIGQRENVILCTSLRNGEGGKTLTQWEGEGLFWHSRGLSKPLERKEVAT